MVYRLVEGGDAVAVEEEGDGDGGSAACGVDFQDGEWSDFVAVAFVSSPSVAVADAFASSSVSHECRTRYATLSNACVNLRC